MLLLKFLLFLTTLVGISLAQFEDDGDYFRDLIPRAKAKAKSPSPSPPPAPAARSKAAAPAKKDTKSAGATNKAASSDAMNPSQLKEWAKQETYYRSTYNVPLLALKVPVPNSGPALPLPGKAKASDKASGGTKTKAKAKGKRDVKDTKGKDIGVQKSDAGSGWGSIPIPQPPGFPNPGLVTQPIPGNGQAPVAVPDPRPSTAANPNLPSIDDIVSYLDQRWPEGRDAAHVDRGDIRQRLLFWTGGGMDAAQATANQLGLYTLADLVGNHYERYTTLAGGRQFDPDTVGMWDRLSLALARWANGHITVRINADADGQRGTSIWNTFERPTLEQRGITIRWLNANGVARSPVYPNVTGNTQPGNQTGSSASKKAKAKRALMLVARATHMGLLRRGEAMAIATKIMRRDRMYARRDIAKALLARRDAENMYHKRREVEDWHVRRDAMVEEEDFVHEFW